ncbi:ABC-F family ATP-binding cassette domain-containing protein [Chryseolinea sp. T2]|uniref:ABC-F family ATP-binding cassette domain-containing protein n=1 Tax=Chryseolinea sp. T2 TaxID=3129255 RepID=UPI0030768F6C
MLTLNGVSYTLPDGKHLFSHITFSLSNLDKAALIGNNGIGKSTLFRIITGEIHAQGTVAAQERPYYIPQLAGQSDHLTIGQALRVDARLTALKNILDGNASEADFITVGDDWNLEDRIYEALDYWQLGKISPEVRLAHLSGGQRTKVFLAGLKINDPKLVLLDEPTNHLDQDGRRLLYDFISKASKTMLITSHDRVLLNLVNPIIELSRNGATLYGGNYDFYREQYEIEQNALVHDVQSKEKMLRKAREKERETVQRQQKLNSRGRGKQEKAGLPTILQHALKNAAERSTSKIKDVHATKIQRIAKELSSLRGSVPDVGAMKLNLDNADLHTGKLLFEAKDLNFKYDELIWSTGISLQIHSGERIAIKGSNGSGKTTLMKIILGQLLPDGGIVKRSPFEALYIDQEYSLIDNEMVVVAQAQAFNKQNLEEHEVNIRLNRFLFPKETWLRKCGALSGGERMRLTLCCLHISHHAPDMIVLDEPTNNLDIQSAEILTSAINSYQGTIVVISHDEHFLRSIKIEREIIL